MISNSSIFLSSHNHPNKPKMLLKSLHHSLLPLIYLLLLLLLSPTSLSDEFNDDVLGLIVFKASLTDPHSKLTSWTDTDDKPCKWTGITCDPNTTRVTHISLPNFSLSGSISRRGLLRLQSLQSISLPNNNLTGSIPSELSLLWSLQSIDFSGNHLSGSIPHELFQQCGSLTSISLSNNNLSGELPDTLPSCMSLRSLNFSYNQLSGRLPSTIWSLSGLESLDLSVNSLQGEIPNGIGNMYGLKLINLGRNSFSGIIPDNIGSCSNLRVVDFSHNSLVGELPDTMKYLNVCTSLNLSGNSLVGEVPNWIGQIQSLEHLDLSSNGFYGRIPTTLENLQSLKELNFSWNGFVGDLPDSLKKCGSLMSIDVSGNLLAGDMPNWVFELGLRCIRLSGNRFSGNIHVKCDTDERRKSSCNGIVPLEVLDLSENELDGEIPREIGDFRRLILLNLSGNSLAGSVPKSISKLSLIQVVDLSNNRFNGSIPSEIEEIGSLKELNLGKNLLSGNIPSQIGKSSSLTVLILSENNLTGQIPTTICNLTHLHHVDLSKNNLSGPLPKDLTSLAHLTSFNISNNNLSGELPAGGFFNTIPISSLSGNPSLCGSRFNTTCPATHPKPIVLNPNPDDHSTSVQSRLHHKKLVLSISALIAIAAAAVILLGVVTVSILNIRARNSLPQFDPTGKDVEFGDGSCGYKHHHSSSPMSDSEYGKLVMFSGEADFGSTGAEKALLNKDCEIGRGGFGAVYRATVGDGKTVAIKKLNATGFVKSMEDFEREVKRLGEVHHPNLVSLEGYYWTTSMQLLINEYVSGGSLYDHLHLTEELVDESVTCTTTLSWQQRFKVITGIAKGLTHLHQMDIIHFNLKSTNILLEEVVSGSAEPKIGDFGLAKLLPMLDRYVLSSKIQSALGYMAPEFACRTVRITEKCDVYGFGVLVMEIVTGRKPVEYMEDDVVVLCDTVREALEDGRVEDVIDKRLRGDYPADEVVPVVKLGLICASQVPSNRPEMAEVVNILELIGCCPGGGEVREETD